ncbi:MAG: CAP domain-containing protein, partial [Deltaproteobacteria bacterium]|nr:CAP domain-containing protein [Deltaproteobacteria bacterium]
PPPPPNGLSPVEQELFDLINQERVARGLGRVVLREDLICAAKRHSHDVGTIRKCTHTGSDGTGPGDRVAACNGSGWSGEIVACGHGTPRAAVDGWIGSPGHNAIMFTAGQREIGVGMYNNYWTAIFDR